MPMTRLSALLTGTFLVLVAAVGAGEETASLPVFPGAAGFGVQTPAGRGGALLRVTNLNNDGAGSLREAIDTEGPRVIVFEVGGVIDIGKAGLVVEEPFVTIAGQTAPPPGITLIGGRIQINTHDVLMRHIRVRAGDKYKGEPDCLSVGSYDGKEVHNVVVDHCSFTWSVDECASVSGRDPYPHDITFSNCIIAEALSHATHSKGEHSKGTLIHNECKRVALIGNLFAHNFRRSPYLKRGTSAVLVNNVIYNPGQLGLHISCFGGSPAQVSVVGNVFIAGPNTPEGLGLISTMGKKPTLYVQDCLARDTAGAERSIKTSGGSGEVEKWRARYKTAKEPVIWLDSLAPLPGADTLEHVLANVGAFPAARDVHDARIAETVREGKGVIIDSQEQVGGYPDYPKVERPLRFGNDLTADPDGNGYTQLEETLQRAALFVEGRLEKKPGKQE